MPYTSRETYDFISKQTNDPIVEWKTCKVSGQPFPIYQSDVDFYDKISPTFNGKKYQIPTPTLCPEERQRRRFAFRNERKMYKTKASNNGQEILSLYSPDKLYKVYEHKFRDSDGWNVMMYNKEYNAELPFSKHLETLRLDIPRTNFLSVGNENGDYSNYVLNSKNTYMSYNIAFCENVFYATVLSSCTNCCDCTNANTLEWSYEIMNGNHMYKSLWCNHSNNLQNSMYCYNCANMTNCLFCVNIQGKNNYLFNQPSTAEQIAIIKKEVLEGRGKHYLQHFQTLQHSQILSATESVSCEGCLGGSLTNTKDTILFFESGDNEHCKYGFSARGTKNSLDIYAIEHGNFCYECISGSHNNMKCAFNIACGECESVYYSNYCLSCHHCFGCVGLRNQSYCILNKQYTKEEYERRVTQIIEHMQRTGERGEFFHPSLSPFGYNETVAQEYFPMPKEEALSKGFQRSDYSSDPKIPENTELLHPVTLPDDQRKTLVNDESILRKIIICAESGRPFIIQKLELDFYRKMGLPLPKLHPDLRHEARMKQRPGRTLHLRTCDKCGKEMVSIYPANETRTVYCEECYKQEVFG